MNELKDWVIDNLLGKTKKIIAKKTDESWFLENGFLEKYHQIINTTSFLFNNPSMSQRVWHIINDKPAANKCNNPECNNSTTFLSFIRGYLGTCCNRCAQKVPETCEKIRATNMKKYGHAYGLQSSEIKEKRVSTCLEKYGVDNVSKLDIISARKKETCLKNYGVSWILQDTDRIQHGVMKKYGVDNVQKSAGVQLKTTITRRSAFYDSLFSTLRLNERAVPLFTKDAYINGGYYEKYKFKCKKCSTIFEDCLEDGDIPRCTDCYKGSSTFEKEVTEYIKLILGTSVTIIENDKKTLSGNYELDILLPSINIAIECNGLFWHGEMGGNKLRKYHLQKTIECEKKNIQLIHIFEDEWINHSDIVKIKLSHLLKQTKLETIYARKCIIKEISSTEKNIFLNTYHIQGQDTSSIKTGLFYMDKLVGVMTFGHKRIFMNHKQDNKSEFELIRYASSSHVIGGAGKLLNYFIKKYTPTKIISYADRRWTFYKNNLYEKLGFEKVSDGTPNYWYFGRGKEYKRYHRFGFRKNVLAARLKIFDSNLSEWENMKNNEWDRIWDCGNLKYVMTF
jgi:hypothetical protein